MAKPGIKEAWFDPLIPHCSHCADKVHNHGKMEKKENGNKIEFYFLGFMPA